MKKKAYKFIGLVNMIGPVELLYGLFSFTHIFIISTQPQNNQCFGINVSENQPNKYMLKTKEKKKNREKKQRGPEGMTKGIVVGYKKTTVKFQCSIVLIIPLNLFVGRAAAL